jgi:hypothetical protein
MVTVYVPPPSASEVMDMMARWVARTQGVKVTVHVEGTMGESTTVIDGRMPALDVCTDPDNCKRCKAPAWEKHRHEHAGLRFGPNVQGNAPDTAP